MTGDHSAPARLARLRGSARVGTGALEALAAGLMALIVLLVLANALGRYLFTRPLPWTEELVVTVMIWVASVGVLLGALRGSLICCDVLPMRLPPRLRRPLAITCGVAGAASLAVFAWQIRVYLGLFGGDVSPILRLPKGLGIAALLCAMASMAAVFLFRAGRLALGERGR